MPADVLELKKLVKQLQNVANDSELVDVLTVLKKDYQVNELVLRESKAGLAVGKLRNHASKSVADAAKDLVKKWKTEVEKAKQVGKAPAPATPIEPPKARSAKNDGVVGPQSDIVRRKCAELIYDGLVVESFVSSKIVLQKACAIEEAIYSDYDGTTTDYKQKIRSLFVNLKDKNSGNLRKRVIDGAIEAEKLHTLAAEDLASDKQKVENEKIKQQNLHNSLGAAEPEAETDAFQCGRCKQRKCRYRQAQTRSADEPMTTFVTCTNCNHRWKFS